MPEDNKDDPISPEDEEILDRLINQVNASTVRASAALDEALGYVEKSEQRLRKKYRLADLLAEMPEGAPLDDPEIREWMDIKPVGREFGTSVMEKFARFSPDFMTDGRGDQEQAEREINPTDE